jgi:hypothetical protein
MIRIFLTAIFLFFASSSLANELTVLVQNVAGGNGIHANIVAKYLPKYINQKVIVKQIPGAAGVVLANYLYNAATKDGNTIGTIQTNVLLQGVLASKSIQYDIEKFTILGAAQDGRYEPYMLWKKVDQKEIIGGIDSSLPINQFKIINRLLGWKAKEITGYLNPNEVKLALERNEITVLTGSLTGVKTVSPYWLTENTIKPIIQWGDGVVRHQDYQDVPTLLEMVSDERAKNVVRILELQNMLLRLYAAPPNIPAERADELRQAMWSVFTDPEYINEAAKIGISKPIDHVESGLILREFVSSFTESMKSEFQ